MLAPEDRPKDTGEAASTVLFGLYIILSLLIALALEGLQSMTPRETEKLKSESHCEGPK